MASFHLWEWSELIASLKERGMKTADCTLCTAAEAASSSSSKSSRRGSLPAAGAVEAEADAGDGEGWCGGVVEEGAQRESDEAVAGTEAKAASGFFRSGGSCGAQRAHHHSLDTVEKMSTRAHPALSLWPT